MFWIRTAWFVCTLMAVAIPTVSSEKDSIDHISVPDPQVRVNHSRTDNLELSTADPGTKTEASTRVELAAGEGTVADLEAGESRLAASSHEPPAQTSTPASEDNRATPTVPQSDHSNRGPTPVPAASSTTPQSSISSGSNNDVCPLCSTAPAGSETSPYPATQQHSNHSGHHTPATATPTLAGQTITEIDDYISYLRSLPPEEKTRRLMEAAEQGAVGELEALLAAGADATARGRDVLRWTALHWAAEGGHEEAARQLLAAGAAVDSRDSDQWTPLHSAAGRGHAAVVRLLLENGADHGARGVTGSTPLHLAAYKGNREAAAALLEAGADRAARDEWGDTPLDDARRRNHQEVVELLQAR